MSCLAIKKRLATRELTHIPSLLYYVSSFIFYLWQIAPVLKYCKVPKYFDQDCRCAYLSNFVVIGVVEMEISIIISILL